MKQTKIEWIYVIQNKNGEWFRTDENGFTTLFSKSLKFEGDDGIAMAKLFLEIFRERLGLEGCKVVEVPKIVFL